MPVKNLPVRLPVVLAFSFALWGCPTGLTPTTPGVTPGPGASGGPRVGGSSAPAAFGSPRFPSPRPFVSPPPADGEEGSPAPSVESPTPAPGPVASPATGSTPVPALSYYIKPTLGTLVNTYYTTGAGGAADLSGATVNLDTPSGVFFATAGIRPGLYFSDSRNNTVRLISSTSGPTGAAVKVLESIVKSFVEDGKAVTLSDPHGVALDGKDALIVVDTGQHALRIGIVGSDSKRSFKTLAGSGTAGYADRIGKDAQFNTPWGVAVDIDGNSYVTDSENHCIRKITTAQVVTTLAGGGSAGKADGTGRSASFDTPRGITIDTLGNLYVADYGNNLIRKVTRDGVVTTVAGSGSAGRKNALGKEAQFDRPIGIGVGTDGTLYVSEENSHAIRKITMEGAVTLYAGTGDSNEGLINGPGTVARFDSPRDLFVDENGVVFVADSANNMLRQILPQHVVTTLAGKGRPLGTPSIDLSETLFPGNQSCCSGSDSGGFADGDNVNAQFDEPWGVAVDADYNVFVADSLNHCIRKVTPEGVVTTVAGSGEAGFANGKGGEARFNTPRAIVIDSEGNLLVADALNRAVRKVTPSGSVTTVAGNKGVGFKNGAVSEAQFHSPVGLALDAKGDLYVSDQGNHVIRKITRPGLSDAAVSTYAGDGVSGYKDDVANVARFTLPAGLAMATDGRLFVADYGTSTIRVVSVPRGQTSLTVATLGGSGNPGFVDGDGSEMQFNNPWALALDTENNLFVADYGNSLVRKLTLSGTGDVWAGSVPGYPDETGIRPLSGYSDGSAIGAAFAAPAGICIDRRGYLYVADSKNHRIRKIH